MRGIAALLFVVFFAVVFFHFSELGSSESNSEAKNSNETTSEKEETAQEEEEIPGDRAVIKEVYDGDTILVEFEETKEIETVRMLLIDTPETKGTYNDTTEPYGIEAKEYLRRLLLKDYVVVIERGEKERDKYDRLLAYVWFQEENINKHMVRQGFAEVAYVEEPNTKYVDSFRKAEKEAKNEELRIWSDN